MPSLFIDGAWVASGDGTCAPTINPSDGTVITEVDVATDDQVQAAIAAARRAFDTTDWPWTPAGSARDCPIAQASISTIVSASTATAIIAPVTTRPDHGDSPKRPGPRAGRGP